MPGRSWNRARSAAWIALLVAVGSAAAAGEPDRPATPKPVVVTVTGPSGRPLASFHVSVLAEPGGQPEFRKPVRVASAVTSATGTARLAILDPAARHTLVVTPPDAVWRLFADHCRTGWLPADTTVQVESANVLRGVVRDPARQPVPRARVRLDMLPLRKATYTGSDGRFAFENLPAGRATVYAEVTLKGDRSLRSIPVQVETSKSGLNLQLPAASGERKPALLVRVVTPNGRPVALAPATFYSTTVEHHRFGRSTTKHTESVFVDGGAARTYDFDVRVWLEVLSARTEFGELLPFGPGRGGPFGPGPEEGSLELPQEEAITGVVLGPAGEPRVGVRVQAVAAPPGTGASPGTPRWSAIAHGEGVSGEGGRFRVGGLERRTYELRARPTRDFVAGPRVEVPAGASAVQVHLRRAARPILRVRDPKGEALAGALVRLVDPRKDGILLPFEDAVVAHTDAAGQARLGGLDPALGYELEIQPPATRRDLLGMEIRGWRPADTEITLDRGRLISGVVRDQAGRPIPRAKLIWAHVKESVAERVTVLTAEAGDDGRFTLENLSSGSYRIWLRPPLKKPAGPDPAGPTKTTEPMDIEPRVVPAGTLDLVLVLPMPASLTFKIRGWEKGVGSVKAWLIPEGGGGRPIVRKLDKDGTVHFDALRWDVRYALWMRAEKETRYVYEPGLVVDRARHDYTLKDGTTVTGRVVGPPGTTGRKVWVAYPGFDVRGRMRAGGRFEIRGLPPGPWTVRASGRKGGTQLAGGTKAKGGDEIEVRLEVK